MKAKRIFTFFFSFILASVFAQNKQDSLSVKWKYEPNFLVGIDVLNAGIGAFSDRQLFQGFISSKVNGKWYAIADVGFENNNYQKNGYNATVSGPFLKLGILYMLTNDVENPMNGFFFGGKIAGSFYQQEYKAVPVRGFGGSDFSQAFPESSQNSLWAEVNIGGRVQLFESPFYLEATLYPKYLVYSSTQDEIKPMIVSGFGKSSAKFNVGFSWSIAFSF